ncbi:hypothetical protein JXA32_03000 [Candidatus Sumerlaeota bacterium]|nr:hypothetical protein [Candidatus Sumerlaeota bacterium]
MSEIYPRLGIDYGGSNAYYFPPYGPDWGPRVRFWRGRQSSVADDPLTDGATLEAFSESVARFELTGEINAATAGDARTEMQNMLTALRGGTDGTFRFFQFHDEYWRHCYVEREDDLEFDVSRAPFGVIGYCVRFTAGDPSVYDDDSVGASPYEDDLYPGETGAATSMVKQKTSYSVTFPGVIAETPEGYDFIIAPEAEAGDTLEVVSIQATCNVSTGASGSTQIRVCREAKGGATTHSILLTLDYDERFSRNTGSFTLSAGESLYIYCEAPGGHQDLMVSVVVEG